MGKSNKRYTLTNIASHDSKLFKYRKYVTVTFLESAKQIKQRKIKENFGKMFRRLMAKQQKNKETYVISFLNIMASCEDLCSLVCMPMPSIENMISHHMINHPDEVEVSISHSQSDCDATENFLSEILRSMPQIPIYFVCLLEKALRLISCPLNKKQNQCVIKGTWNILIKYWKDTGFSLFQVNPKVEWGLLELLSFQFGAGKKQRFEAQQRLRKTLNQIESQNQLRQSQQRLYLCTLDNIQQQMDSKHFNENLLFQQ